MKKSKFKEVLNSKSVILGVAALVVIVGAFSIVSAFTGNALINFESADFGDTFFNSSQSEGIEGAFGADGDSNFTNVVTSGYVTAGGAGTFGGALSVTGASTFAAITASGAADVGNLTQGGGCYASTTVAATDTWTAANMLAYNCFEYNGDTAAAITITLPATSTMTTLLPSVGDTKEWLYQGYTAAATTTTWTAGAGMDLIGLTTNDDVIDGNEYAEIKCTRMTDTDVTCIVSELLHVD